LVAFSVLAMGSFETIPLVVCAVLAFIASVPASLLRGGFGTLRASERVVIGLAVGLATFTALQAIPLPGFVTKALSPHADDVWSRSFGFTGGWHPLSLDPVATRIETLKGLVYLLALIAGLSIMRRERGVRWIERTLFLTAVAVTVVTVAHEALNATKVYGFYTPRTGVSTIGPLMNGNHLSAYVNVGIMIAIGSSLSPRPMLPRAILIALACALTVFDVRVASRGGIGSLLASVFVVAVLARLHRRERPISQRAFAVLGVALLAMAVGTLALSDAAARDLSDRDVSKLHVAVEAFSSMGRAYPLVGVGRGAFESTFQEFRSAHEYYVFSYPENFIVQWASEWGIPCTVLIVVAIVWVLRPGALLRRSSPHLAAWSALIGLGIHNLVDFNLESPGIVMAVIGCVCLVVGGVERHRPVELPPSPVYRISSGMVGGVGLVLVVWCLSSRSRELLSLQQEFAARAQESPAAIADDELRAAMRDHPAEPYFPYVGEFAHAARDDETVPAWAGRALERAPHYGPAHLTLARWLRSRSRSHARLEYRLAQENGYQGGIPVAELGAMVRSFEDVMEITTEGAEAVPTLASLSLILDAAMPATAERLDVEILLRDPEHVAALTRQATRAVSDVEAGEAAPWCTTGCVDAARTIVERVVALTPDRCAGRVLRARLQIATGRFPLAVQALTGDDVVVVDRKVCDVALAEMARAAHEDQVGTAAIDRVAKAACAGADECAGNRIEAADLEQARGNRNRALTLLRTAHELDPDRDDVLERVAQEASAVGMHAESVNAYRQLIVRHPDRSDYRIALSNEERALEP
jgi:tetratricopeptide (TPR) repeat protein